MRAQGADEKLTREAATVRAEIARSQTALRQYTWTEQTEVLVGGSLKASTAFTCRYGDSGEILRTPAGEGKQFDVTRTISKRPAVRAKADLQDYIERAITRIHNYVPIDPKQIDYLLRNGEATLSESADGKPQIRLTHYFVAGDSLTFTYDDQSRALLHATIASILGSPKDPILLVAVFEILPDGVNYLSSARLTAKARNVQVITRNVDYRKVVP